MTDNAKKVLDFLKKNYGKEFSKHEIVEQLDISMSTVTGSINGLLNRGFAKERIEVALSRFKGDHEVEIRYVTLTESGLNYDPYEEEKRKAQERLEARAVRREARRLEKEERAKQNSVL